jgi:hypothetical protein
VAEEEFAPEEGKLAFDTQRQRLGLVMEIWPKNIALRPVGGGTEWWADREVLRKPTVSEELSPGVAAANARSRGEL